MRPAARRRRRLDGLALLLVLAPALCAAQTPPPALVTDRPGFGESSGAVGRATIQIESGVTLAQVDGTHRELAGPQLLARLGVARRAELRFGTGGVMAEFEKTPGGSRHSYGGSDMEVGAKLLLLDTSRWGLELAAIPYVSLPTASRGFGSGHFDPGVKLAASHDLPRGVGVSATYNAADPSGDTGRAWQHEISVSLDHALPRGLSAYGEFDSAFAGGGCGCSIDGGITVPAGANAQFDVEAGHRVHGDAQDWFMGAGVVVRRLRR